MGKLTTHVLDTTRGKPGHAITVSLFRIEGDQRRFSKTVITNDDGRVDSPILEGREFSSGVYELVFSVGSYFAALEPDKALEPENDREKGTDHIRFLDDVVLRFGIADSDEHYHVPLLITPYSYSTYRGS